MEIRFVAGLCAGAWLAHAGWALLYVDRIAGGSVPMLSATSGFCVLFVPFGPLLALPFSRGPEERRRQLAANLTPLPWALAVARLGCVAAGCCSGLPIEASLAGGWERHPAALYECAALAALGALVRRLGDRWRAPAVLAALGGIRLALEPVRARPPLGEPLLPIELVALLWMGIAATLALQALDPERCWRPPRARRGTTWRRSRPT